MFNLDEIKELIKLLDESSVQEIEIEQDGSRVMIRKPSPLQNVVVQSALPMHPGVPAPLATPAASIAPTAPVAENAEPEPNNLHRIVSPMVGTFYRSPSPDAAAFVESGSKVSGKTVVCIIEAMKLMNEIEAEVSGEIVAVLAENGQLVEYGQPLFLVRTE